MGMINFTGDMGLAIMNVTTYTTGSLFLTLLIMVFILVVIGMALRLPIEMTIPLVFPILIASAVVTSEMFPALAVAAIYMSILFVRNFFLT